MNVTHLCIILGLLLSVESLKKKNIRGLIPVTRFEKIGVCDGGKFPNIQSYTEIKLFEKGMSSINMNMTIGEHPPPTLTAIAKSYKCKSIDDTNCESFVQIKVNFCEILGETKKRKVFYSRLLDFTPPLRCPIKPNTSYYMLNGTMDTNSMLGFVGIVPPEYFNLFWKIKMVLTDGAPPYQPQYCIYFIFKVIHIKA